MSLRTTLCRLSLRHLSVNGLSQQSSRFSQLRNNGHCFIRNQSLLKNGPASFGNFRNLVNTTSTDTIVPEVETFPEIEVVSKNEVVEFISSNKGVIIDVRNMKELMETGIIGDAINIPVKAIENVFSMSNESFSDLIDSDKPKKDDLIIIYCRSGVRAGHATRTLINMGFKNVKRYPGSWKEWSVDQ